MLTDEQLLKLHKNESYKKSMSSRNIFVDIFGTVGHERDFMELSTDFSSRPQFSVKIVKIIWIIYRYFRVTHEVSCFRKNLIEALLTQWYASRSVFELLEECMVTNPFWIDLTSMTKVKYLKDCCIRYVNDAENRKILKKYVGEKDLENLYNDLKNVFDICINNKRKREEKMVFLNQIVDNLSDDQYKKIWKKNVEDNYCSGNLTRMIN